MSEELSGPDPAFVPAASSPAVSTEGFNPGQWHPIETAPRDDEVEVLVTNGSSVFVASWAYEDRWQPTGLPTFKPTHWMHLPSPPLTNV